MALYLVTYDVIGKPRNYLAIFEAIKQISNGYWHELGSVWIINTSLDAVKIRNYLNGVFDNNDQFFVVNIGQDWASYNLPDSASKWLRLHVPTFALIA